jgi:hypothetical protein
MQASYNELPGLAKALPRHAEATRFEAIVRKFFPSVLDRVHGPPGIWTLRAEHPTASADCAFLRERLFPEDTFLSMTLEEYDHTCKLAHDRKKWVMENEERELPALAARRDLEGLVRVWEILHGRIHSMTSVRPEVAMNPPVWILCCLHPLYKKHVEFIETHLPGHKIRIIDRWPGN